MSEYQYYEFRAVDRSLTREQMAELREVSSRGAITPTSYTNEYSWGDFKGDPSEWMDLYFDAFFYYANWGTKTFMLKLPVTVIAESLVNEYSCEELCARTSEESTVITLSLEPCDGGEGWQDYDGLMSDLIGLRAELAHGDHRGLYLGWLINRGIEEWTDDPKEDEDDLEPPVPPGLQELTASQQSLVDFFGIEPDLISAAAVASPAILRLEPQESAVEAWITRIDLAKKEEYLLRVLRGEGTAVGLELSSKFVAESQPSAVPPVGPRRTVRELMALARAIQEARLEREAAEKEDAKNKRLDAMLARVPGVWEHIDNLANIKKTAEYDVAVRMLAELGELSNRGDIHDFVPRIIEFRARHFTKRALLERLDRAGLPG